MMTSSVSALSYGGTGFFSSAKRLAEASCPQKPLLFDAAVLPISSRLKGGVERVPYIGRERRRRGGVVCFSLKEEEEGERQRQSNQEVTPADHRSAESASSSGSGFPDSLLLQHERKETWREAEAGQSEGEDGLGVRPPYGVITSLALAGVAETAYLTWSKLFGDGTVTCPMGGGCNDVLNSDYAVLFGLPLSLYGLVAYSGVAVLSQLSREGRDSARWVLLAATSLMATASGFLLYLLAFKLDSPSCTYCFASAALSISLFLSTGWGFTTKELKKAALPQLALSMGTILAFSLAFGDVRSAQAGSGDIDLPPLEPEVLTVSTSREVSLAKHLKAVGAKMYGAFWCSHCYEQKQMFGREAMKYLDYVECYPEGYRRGVQLNPACEAAGIEGFPTWVVDGKILPGERSLEELAQVSGYVMSEK